MVSTEACSVVTSLNMLLHAEITIEVESNPDDEEVQQDATEMFGEQGPEGNFETDIKPLKQMFWKFLADLQDREVHEEQEAAWQKKWKLLQHQFQLLQGEISVPTGKRYYKGMGRKRSSLLEPPPIQDQQVIFAFLNSSKWNRSMKHMTWKISMPHLSTEL